MGRNSFQRVLSDASSKNSLVALIRNPSTTHHTTPSSPTTTIPSIPISPITPNTPTSPASNISAPASVTRLRRISELVDPWDLFDAPFLDMQSQLTTPAPALGPSHFNTSSQILAESPSGHNFLSAEQFIAHPHRALSMRERRELIATNTRVKLESRAEMRPEAGVEERAGSRSKLRGKRRVCWFRWC